MTTPVKPRRRLITGLGTSAAALALGTGSARAQAPAATAFQPARHPQDEWLSAPAGRHRVVLDVVSPAGVADAIRFAANLFTGSTSGYGVDEADVAIVICLRHGATSYAYTDTIWSKYGRAMRRGEEASAPPPPTTNQYETGDRRQLSALATRGVRFMVCGLASRGIAQRAAGQTGSADSIFKELEAALIPSARLVAAGVVGVTHAQEHGYSYLYVG